MKKTGIGLIITLVLLGVYLAVKPEAPVKEGAFQNLPWQIDVLEDGRSEVFGLTLEGSTFAQVDALLGEDRQLAVLLGEDNEPRLEMYYKKFSAGPISGRLILSFEADAETLLGFIEKRPVSEYTRSGSRKYLLGSDYFESIKSSVLKQLIYIPTINLDAFTIEERFGVPNQTMSPEPMATRYLYPARGLDIVIHEESKEVIRYVAPRSWLKNP